MAKYWAACKQVSFFLAIKQGGQYQNVTRINQLTSAQHCEYFIHYGYSILCSYIPLSNAQNTFPEYIQALNSTVIASRSWSKHSGGKHCHPELLLCGTPPCMPTLREAWARSSVQYLPSEVCAYRNQDYHQQTAETDKQGSWYHVFVHCLCFDMNKYNTRQRRVLKGQ